MCFGNLWGTVCHNSWDNRDAGVICKQLFNSSYGGLFITCIFIYVLPFEVVWSYLLLLVGGFAINGSKFGSGDIPIVLENLNCNGTEDSVTDCSVTNSVRSSCNSSTIAGITCYGMLYVCHHHSSWLYFCFVPANSGILKVLMTTGLIRFTNYQFIALSSINNSEILTIIHLLIFFCRV